LSPVGLVNGHSGCPVLAGSYLKNRFLSLRLTTALADLKKRGAEWRLF